MKVIGLLTLFLVCAPIARASLVVYEGFNGYQTGDLTGQSVVNTVGLTGAYGTTGENSTYTVWYQTSGLSFGSIQTSGGSAWCIGYDTSATVGLASSVAVQGTMWSSYLVKAGSSIGGNVLVATKNNSSGTLYGRTAANAGSLPGVAYGESNWNGSISGSSQLAGNTTYMVVSKFTNVGMSLSASQTGTLREWILTLDQFQNWEANGLSESYLTAATAGTGSNQIYAITGVSVSASGTYSFDNQCSLSYAGQYTNNITFDELRYGTELSDVIVVPEPASWALALLGVTVLMGRQRWGASKWNL